MNKQIEALKMAIEAMNNVSVEYGSLNMRPPVGTNEAIQACKQALAEAALNQMQKNAEELGLTYCKHGSDSACKECYMEQTSKEKNHE